MSALCVEYGISRQTGHKWIRRYREQGYLGLVEQLSPRLPSYPAEWLTRRVSGVGNVRVSGDNTFLSTALAGQLVGLWRESELHWRVHYFDVDLGTIEVLPLNDAFASETVIKTVTVIQARTRRAVSANP